MSTIDTTTLKNIGVAAADSVASNKKSPLGQSDFLKLMMTQLKNQDPTKPMDNGQFIAQIAQFSTVSGIQDLQDSFKQVATAMQSNQALQASALVGRGVLAPLQGSFVYPGKGGVTGAVELKSSTNSVVVELKNKAGELVQRVDLGQRAAGMVDFKWDGTLANGNPAPNGAYTISAIANVDGKPVNQNTFLAVAVHSVTLGQGGQEPTLNLGGMGSMPFSKIREVM